jgi:hypothetical protein
VRTFIVAGLGILVSTFAVATAQAATTVTVDIYNGSCNVGGSPSCSALNSANTAANTGSGNTFHNHAATGTISTTGTLSTIFSYNLQSGSDTIGGFLGSNSPAANENISYYSGNHSSDTLSTPTSHDWWGNKINGFGTEFVFTGSITGASSISITHDDGIAFFFNGVLVTPTDAAGPTSAETTTFLVNGPGTFVLDYVAANGLPEVLQMSVSAVPLPPAISLFGTGLAALGFLGWRKKRATAAI